VTAERRRSADDGAASADRTARAFATPRFCRSRLNRGEGRAATSRCAISGCATCSAEPAERRPSRSALSARVARRRPHPRGIL
jgi:hypothetical protein